MISATSGHNYSFRAHGDKESQGENVFLTRREPQDSLIRFCQLITRQLKIMEASLVKYLSLSVRGQLVVVSVICHQPCPDL